MASLSCDAQGYRLRFAVGGLKKSVRLTHLGPDAAERALHHVEVALRSHRMRQAIPVKTLDWLHHSAPPGVLSAMSDLRVVDDRRLLGDAWRAWVTVKTPSVSSRRIEAVERVGDLLLADLGDVELESITERLLLEWAESLTFGKSANTVAHHCGLVKQFFKWAVTQRLIVESTAKGLSSGFVPSDRLAEVSEAMAAELVAAADVVDPELGLAVRLARWGGLRAAEILRVHLSDIAIERRSLAVRDTKRAHHGHGTRTIPIFPELDLILDAAQSRAADRSVAGRRGLLLPGLGSLSTSAMSQRAVRLGQRLGLDMPARFWQNSRATRESELMDQHGIVRACKWIGNSPEVAMRHYAIVRSVDFDRASGLGKDVA